MSRQFFANSNISVNILASVFGAAILFGFFLLCECCNLIISKSSVQRHCIHAIKMIFNVSITPDLLLVNPAGFWGAMMDEMVGYMSGRGE